MTGIPSSSRALVMRLVKAGLDAGRHPADIADSICDALVIDCHWQPPGGFRNADDRQLWEDALDRERDGSAL